MTRKEQRHRPGNSAAASQTARLVAYDVLAAWQQRGAFAGRVLEELSSKHKLTGADRALALDISYTAIRRQATIDAILTAFVDRSRNEVDDGLWRLLQIGVCQLVFLEGVPAYAALNETADLASRLHKPRWTGVVNGVLRSIAASLENAPENRPVTHQVPIGELGAQRFDRPIFSDPAEKPAHYLAKALSFPRWLMRDWLDRHGFDEAMRLCRWFNVPGRPTVRVNVLQQSTDVVRETLVATGVTTQPGSFPEALRACTSFRPADIPGFEAGWFSIQDESAMAAVRLLDPRPGDRILDLCAAPGGKTTLLAEMMNDEGTIIAADIDAERLRLVTENASRLRLTSITPVVIGTDGSRIPDGPFDGVLVDVPCSNTGVLGKRPEARWRITPEGVDELVEMQTRLLTLAVEHVRAGGTVVYSTCSIDPRENREVVDRVLAASSELALEEEQHHIPGQPADGGYQARFRR